jgi:hypothetical protein
MLAMMRDHVEAYNHGGWLTGLMTVAASGRDLDGHPGR